MIHILFFIEELSGGGAEKVLCNLVNSMDPDKFDITVQTLFRTDPGNRLRSGVHYRFCYKKRNSLHRFLSRAEAALGLTYRLHIKAAYDIEVAYLECGATKIISASTNRHAKKIAWVHCDLQKKMYDPQAFAKKAKNWYRKFDRVVCVSGTVLHSFVSLFGTSQKPSVLYNTVDDQEILRKAAIELPSIPRTNRPLVVSAGRLSYEKGYDVLLRVHKRLMGNGFLHDLWLVGDGSERDNLEAYILQNNLQDSVRLLGYQENPYPYLNAADLLVCPSRFEGFSTFITEGLILGKPIVTTECSGMQELLGNSDYGFIAENSEDGLYYGMEKLLSSPSLLQEYACRAASRGHSFQKEALTQKTEEYFQDLLSNANC